MNAQAQSSDSLPTRGSLLIAAIAAEPMAWHQLVTLYEPRLRRWCRGRGLDEIAAADVIQDVWMSVARGLATFRSKPGAGSFRAWLYQIARRRIADHQRKQSSMQSAVGGSSFAARLAELPCVGKSLSDGIELTRSYSAIAIHQSAAAMNAEANIRECAHNESKMQQAMKSVEREVDQNTWQAFWLCVVDQRSTNDVASSLAMTPANVRQCRSRVLRRLRHAMASCMSANDS